MSSTPLARGIGFLPTKGGHFLLTSPEMAKFYEELTEELRNWALKQQVFFVASAPLFGEHVNVSPKGLPASTFTVLDSNTACYIDATGSGAETIAHVYETKRATIMFCSFDKTPRIMRLFCTGRVIEYDQPGFGTLLKRMGKDSVSGARAVILLNIFKVQTSCGYAVPLLTDASELEANHDGVHARLEDRKTLGHWASKQVEKGELKGYQAQKNSQSLDGLGGLKAARRDNGEILWLGDIKEYLRRLGHQWDAILIGVILALASMLMSGYLPVLSQRLPSVYSIV